MARGAAAGLAVLLAGVAPVAEAEEALREVAPDGFRFLQFNGAAGDFLLPEITCAGVALLDYDGDGDLDVYLLQGAPLAGREPTEALLPRPAGALTDRLFRNDLAAAGPAGRRLELVDVTAASGVEERGYGCGLAAGDFDDDGHVDLYVANVGANRLLRNRGDGSFEEVAGAGGADHAGWSVAPVWFDYDGDGRLDLFVGGYVELDESAAPKICRSATGARDYCNPAAYEAAPDRLFRNLGEGRFEDVSEPSGIGRGAGKTLGAVAADFDGDGRLDLYLANDGEPNRLWLQRAGGRFEEQAMLAGCALNRDGEAEASMGVVAEDLDGDGDLDLLMTHLAGETHTLYRNDGAGGFEDVTVLSGLGPPSLRSTGWGLAWLDLGHDGVPDLAVANGAVRAIEELSTAGDPYPFHQPNQLFRGAGGGRFEDVSAAAGTPFTHSEVSRALAAGDLDNDGDTDLALANIGGPARLLLDDSTPSGGWLGVRAVGAAGGDRPGARVGAWLSGAGVRWRRAHTDGSFGAAHDPRTVFGLGAAGAVERLELRWPGGGRSGWRSPPPGCYLTVREPATARRP